VSLFIDSAAEKGAVISDCGLYRYRLWRAWNTSLPAVCFVCLNPSTADALDDDPTIRRCIGFANAWGFGGIEVVNLFAYRSAYPHLLFTADVDPVGPENDRCIVDASLGRTVIAAWGALPKRNQRRIEHVIKLLGKAHKIECLGTTKHGHPRHPLYLPGNVERVAFGGAR
jgi:hypothetical protein